MTRARPAARSAFILVVAGLCGSAWAGAAPPPPCQAQVYSQFDFWVGDWQVHDVNGVLQGTNVIRREEAGCLLVERWTGAQGGTGQSYNFYDPASSTWRQLWVNTGAIIDYRGGLKGGAMHLAGEITYRANGQVLPFTGTWTPRADGTVLQELKQWDPESKQWTDWFTGVYSPAGAP